MKIILFSVIAVAMFGLVISSVSAQEQVPSWVKNTAGWWATDAISETEFVNAIEFLIQNNIIVIESDVSSLLLTWDEIVNDAKLKIPHPGMIERQFVLYPLQDIEPDYFFNHINKNINDVIYAMDDTFKIIKLSTLKL